MLGLTAMALVSSLWSAPELAPTSKCIPEGEAAVRIERALARLKAPPFTSPFILADVDFNQKRIFTEYSGDISGRIVGVDAAQIAAGQQPVWPLEPLFSGLARAQQPDGHFGAPQQLDREITGERDMPILWGNGRMLAGLVEAEDALHNGTALALAKRLGDYYVKTDPQLDRAELVNKFGTESPGFMTCYFSGIEGLVGVTRLTGDKQYLAQAKRMAELMARASPLAQMHSHGRLCSLRGVLDIYEATGEKTWLDRVENEFTEIRKRYLLPTAGLDEMFALTFPRSEGCSEADLLRLELQLWRLTGKDEYLDLAELTLRNEMAVNQLANGGFGHHYLAYAGQAMDGYLTSRGEKAIDAYWCCAEHGPRALFAALPYVAAARGKSVWLNLYEPGRTGLKVGGSSVVIRQASEQQGQLIRVRVEAEKPSQFALRFRVPAWANGWTLNGRPVTRQADGRFTVSRLWKGATELVLRRPYSLFIAKEAELPALQPAGSISDTEPGTLLFLGPYLLGRKIPDSEPAVRQSPVPSARVRGAVTNGSTLTVTLIGSDGLPLELQPVDRISAAGDGYRLRVNLAP